MGHYGTVGVSGGRTWGSPAHPLMADHCWPAADERPSPVLQEARVELIHLDQCNSTQWYHGEVFSTNVCAGYPEGKIDTCQVTAPGAQGLRTPPSRSLRVPYRPSQPDGKGHPAAAPTEHQSPRAELSPTPTQRSRAHGASPEHGPSHPLPHRLPCTRGGTRVDTGPCVFPPPCREARGRPHPSHPSRLLPPPRP